VNEATGATVGPDDVAVRYVTSAETDWSAVDSWPEYAKLPVDVTSLTATASDFCFVVGPAATVPESFQPEFDVSVAGWSPNPTTARRVSLAWAVVAVVDVVIEVAAVALFPVAVLSTQDVGSKLSNS